MGATFTKATAWQGSLQGGYQVASKVAGMPDPPDGSVYRRKRNISDRFRIGQGLTAFTSSAGTEVMGDDLDITNGPDSPTWGGEPAYIVTANNCEPDPPGSGLWRETFVAEGFTAWELWEIPT